MIRWGNSLALTWKCGKAACSLEQQRRATGVFKHLKRIKTLQHKLCAQPSQQGYHVLRGLGLYCALARKRVI